jgi:phenylpyruvate tautomerase PptA (4-oxalocrotonate tautomerase family)
MPIVHIYTAEGWVSPARKKLMVENVTRAIVEAEGVPKTREMTYVLVHEVPDGGWGYQGVVLTKQNFAAHVPPDPGGDSRVNGFGALDAGEPQLSPDWWVPAAIPGSAQPTKEAAAA